MANGRGGNKVVVIGILVLVTGGILLHWQILAGKKKGNFVEAIRAGEVDGLPVDLRDKVWSDEELANARVIKLDDSYGPQRSIERAIHTRGEYTISSRAYSYQAIVTDTDTGIKHIFGYSRREPARWRWVTVHRDSALKRTEQRMQRQRLEGGEVVNHHDYR